MTDFDFKAVYEEYFRYVYLYIKGLSRDERIAEEITEETFFKVLQKIDTYRGECDIRFWLIQIAKNTYFTYLKKNKKIDFVGDFEEEAIDQRVEIKLMDQEAALQIHRILHKLEEPYKEVFHLRVFGELSFQQIGEVFGKTANWACVTYHRAKIKILKEMEE